MSKVGTCAMTVIVATVFATPLLAETAHSLADKFAAAAEREAANSEAEERAAKLIDAQRKAAEARRAEEIRRREQAEAEARLRQAENARRLEEAEMLARARLEAETMQAAAEEARLKEETRRLAAEAEQQRAKAAELLALERTAEQPALGSTRNEPGLEPVAAAEIPKQGDRNQTERSKEAAAPLPALPAPRQDVTDPDAIAKLHVEESRRLAEKLKRVRQIREARIAAGQARAVETGQQAVETAGPGPGLAGPKVAEPRETSVAEETPIATPQLPTSTLEAPATSVVRAADRPSLAQGDAPPPPYDHGPGARRLQDTQVTVLLVMAPGTYGIRRGARIADPVLCVLDGCYVSLGPDRPARFLPGRRALGFGNTWGGRAAACNGSLGCVFRNVDLGRLPGYVQPVDLHILKHDRRSGQEVRTDSACRVEADRLTCHQPLLGETYALWVVPEAMAVAAGPSRLQRAIAEGLDGSRAARLSAHMPQR